MKDRAHDDAMTEVFRKDPCLCGGAAEQHP